jgi:hypothetical protein
MKRSRDDVLFFASVALWVGILCLTWPRALSFGDEVGYVGRAKLLLEGHLSYVVPHSPGVWVPTSRGLVGKYPLLQSLLLAPLDALAPRAMFLLAVSAALLLAFQLRAILKSWGKSPLWATLVLAHPTIVILARTTMADVGQAAAAVAGWWALRRGRRFATVVWLAVLVALKPTGAVLALGIVAGEALSSLAALRARDATTWRRLAWGAGGGVAGFALLATFNLLANGRVWFDYTHASVEAPPFALRYLTEVAPAHVKTLLLLPPLLFLGALPLWRRRELAPLVVSAGYFALMCVYFFVDVGANSIETLVLAPRLLLPVVAFLLIGYAAGLDDLAVRVGAASPANGEAPSSLRLPVAAALVLLPLVVAGAVSMPHARYQFAMSRVRDLASALADAYGERTLGVTGNALKAGLLHDGPTTVYDPASNRPLVVFCSEVSASRRVDTGAETCKLPGYHTVTAHRGFFALLRDDARGDAH